MIVTLPPSIQRKQYIQKIKKLKKKKALSINPDRVTVTLPPSMHVSIKAQIRPDPQGRPVIAPTCQVHILLC